MKKVLTGLAVTLVAAIWMTGSWLFFNSIAAGAQGSGAAAVAEAGKAGAEAEGDCGGHWMHHHRGHHGHHLWKTLNLTDAQKKEMFSIRLEERAKIKPLVQKLKAGRDQFRDLIKSGKFDEEKVRSVAKAQADIRTEIIVERVRMMSRMYAVLTPEQRAKAEKLHESWKARHEKEHQD